MSLWQRVQRRLGDLAGELVLDEYRDQLNHAQALLVARDTTAAIDVLEALLVAKPDHGQALILLVEARLVAKDPERAAGIRTRSDAARRRSGSARLSCPRGAARHATSLRSRPLARAVLRGGCAIAAILADAYRGLGIAWRRGRSRQGYPRAAQGVTEDGEDLPARIAPAKRSSQTAARSTRHAVTSNARRPRRNHLPSRSTASPSSRSSRNRPGSPASCSRKRARSATPMSHRSASNAGSTS